MRRPFFSRKACKQMYTCICDFGTVYPRSPGGNKSESCWIYSYNFSLGFNDLLTDLGPSTSQSSDGGASAAFRILVDSSLHCYLFWAMHLRCSRSSLVVSCNVFSCSLDRSLLRTTGSVVKGRPRNFFPCVAK